MLSFNKRLTAMLGAAALLLMVPLIGMQFSSEINWSAFDFVVMGSLLLCLVLFSEGVVRLAKSPYWRTGLIILGIITFLLIWAELAVGIFGSPFAGS